MYYDGEFTKGLMHGKGQLVWPDGRVCSGTWLNGERSTKETSTITWTNGDVYSGSLDKLYRPSGFGTKTYSDGDKYEGQWEEGLAHGDGVLHQHGVYTGKFSGGQKEGEGEQRYEDGAVYVGAWKENQPSGAGVLTYANKDVYSGAWLKGKQNGEGVLKYSNGDVSQGTFENDALHGPQSPSLGRPRATALPASTPTARGSRAGWSTQTSVSSRAHSRTANPTGKAAYTSPSPSDSEGRGALLCSPLVINSNSKQ
jgi:hypothetical protein